MVNKSPVPFESDSLEDLFNSAPTGDSSVAALDSDTAERLARIREATASISAPLHREVCPKCRGSKCWQGRIGYPCFACKGKGYKEFKTSAESRFKAKTQAVARASRNAAAAWESFAAEHADLAAWIVGNPSFDFAAKMRAAVERFGALTDGQELAIRKCMARSEEYQARKAAAVAAKAATVAAAPILDIGKLESAMASAKTNGLKSPKLRIAEFIVKYAGAGSVNAGALYVLARGSRAYLGKVQNGRFIRSRDCSDAQESAFLAAAIDPAAAAIAYGQRTGTCACCGAELTNSESIARGIGPICASKFGW